MFKHQQQIFDQTKTRETFAFFLEQGTGKTKLAIDTAAYLYNIGKIDALAVVAPKGVHFNWSDELAIHLPDYISDEVLCWDSAKAASKSFQLRAKEVIAHDGLRIFLINVDAVNTKSGFAALKRFLELTRAMFICDESQTIKNPRAQRTKKMLKLAALALYRRVLTGTPVTQGPLDLYTQLTWLDDSILGFSSFYGFRNHFAVLEEALNRRTGKMYTVVADYKNLNELLQLINPYSVRVTKDECLDLPAKLYQKRYVALSNVQRRLYDQMRDELVAELEGEQIMVQMALTKMLRLMQITGGNFPLEGGGTRPIHGDPFDDPRLMALLDVLDLAQGKVIIWARFTAEIKTIKTHLAHHFDNTACVVTYHGEDKTDARREALDRFKHDDTCRFFVANPAAGGMGLTLTSASTVIYYSNGFSLTTRLQSEDRAHRIGQTKNVTYIDLIAKDTLDQKVVEVLRSKKVLADLITGDDIKNWL